MSLRPLFTSAPRIKLRANGALIGYALGFNINVSVDVQPVYVLGQYEPVSLEPALYSPVSGTMQIVRLRNLAQNLTNPSGNTYQVGVDGNGKQTVFPSNSPEAAASNSPLSQAALFKHLDPRTILFSQSFDIDLYLKVPVQDSNDPTGQLVEQELPWMTIKDCRITSRNTNISMGQLVNEPLNFQGLLATPTGTTAQFSLDQSARQS